MQRSPAIVAVLLAVGAFVPVLAADPAPPVMARPGRSASPFPLGTVGGIARPGDPDYQPGSPVRPDRTFAPNRVGGVVRPGDLGAAPEASHRTPVGAPDGGDASRMLAPRETGPAMRGRASGLGIDDPFAGAGGGSGGPAPAQPSR
jgi:hypothetical protein